MVKIILLYMNKSTQNFDNSVLGNGFHLFSSIQINSISHIPTPFI